VGGVSPQSKGRKRKQSRAGDRNRPPGPEMVVARAAQGAIRALEALDDALDAELYTSELLGSWWGKAYGGKDAEVELGERLVAYTARKQRAGAVALLRTVAVLGTDRQREQAAAAADALVASGAEEPGWVRALGTERVAEAWEYGDVYGDQTSVLLVVERAGVRHGVAVLIDHTFEGIAKDAFAVDTPQDALTDVRGFAEDPVAYVHEITPAAAAELLVPALGASDAVAGAGPELPVSDEFAAARALLAARVRLLPAVVPGPEPAPALPDQAARTAVVDEFLASADARDLPPGARGCVELLVDFGHEIDPARPLRVGPTLIDRFLDETLNDGPEISEAEFEALPATLRAWARWAGWRADLPEPAIGELLDAVDDMVSGIGPIDAGAIDAGAIVGEVADAYLAGLDLDGMSPEDLRDVLARRMFAMPSAGTPIGDEEFPFLDPSDPDDRGLLVEGEHPGYHEVLADPASDTVDVTNMRLHIAVHEIVANQLWDDQPPQAWQAARRLLATGAERHDVLHAIGNVLVEHLHGLLTGQGQIDVAAYAAGLEKLGRTDRGDEEQASRVIPLRRKR
jgi:hypothetical protein